MNKELQKLLDEINTLYYDTNEARRIKILVQEDYDDLGYRDDWDYLSYSEQIKGLDKEINEKQTLLRAKQDEVLNKHYMNAYELNEYLNGLYNPLDYV